MPEHNWSAYAGFNLPAAFILQFLLLVFFSLQLCQDSGFFLAEQGILGFQSGKLGLDGQQFFCR